MSVNIHGKEYITVAERLLEAKDHIKSINTEVLFSSPVVIKATVVTDKGSFTGISAANESKAIEKQSPYEVAETSAVGRALGFAGYGIVEGIATADEIVKASFPDDKSNAQIETETNKYLTDETEETGSRVCPKHNKAMTLGQWGWYCKTKDDSAPKGWCTYKIK